MTAWYNEIDPYAAQWLRNLIKYKVIADGYVDERSIEDVRPSDLRGFTQCHFFAGIGVWSWALRLAGWPDSRNVWTGSCPCQPFSTAGKGGGFDDERHLWPAWFWLIAQCQPECLLGEQVAGKNANAWFDLVQTDLEGMDYAFGLCPFPSASVGAPHIRDRAYWVGHANIGLSGWRSGKTFSEKTEIGGFENTNNHGSINASAALALRMGDADCRQQRGLAIVRGIERNGQDTGWTQGGREPESRCDDGDTSPTNGFWRNSDWLACRDGKWRPVEPGTFPLAHGAPARMGRLRAYGNAINAQQAKLFIETVMEYAP